jgi:hypothetical protein
MSIAQKLYKLQEIELEIESNEQVLSRCLGQIGESEALISARAKLSRIEQQIEDLGKEQHSVEWEVHDISTKVAAVREALYSGRIKNPKELTGLQQEEKGLEAKRNKLEERVLDIMEQTENMIAQLVDIKGELKAVEDEWRIKQLELKNQVEMIKGVLDQLKGKHQHILGGIDPGKVDYYYQLKKKKGWPVARIEQGTCCGCRISLSTAELQRARGEHMVECNSCRRILYLG